MSERVDEVAGGWNPEKVAAFREAFMEFLNYVYIDSKELGPIPLGPNLYDAQIRFLDTVFDALANDIHDIYVLKSRQLGLSTVTRALSIFWLGMHEGLKGSFVLDSKDHMAEALIEIRSIMERLPAKFGFPTIRTVNRSQMWMQNNSTALFLSAGVKRSSSGGGLGRGSGVNFVHASEICMWENEEGITSFRQSLAQDFPNRLYVWESTGRGFNAWYRIWQEARADDLSKRCVFLGWWSKPNQRLKRGTPLFERYGTPPVTEKEQERIDAVRELYDFEVTQEQLAWYRKVSNPRGFGADTDEVDEDTIPDDEYFGREQPWTEDEAFAQSGSTFFSSAKLTAASKQAAEIKFTPYVFYTGERFLDMTMEEARTRRHTQLKVWDEPVEGGVYVVAADPAYGGNEFNDRSAIQVFRCYADKLVQCAEFRSPTVQTHQFAWVIASLMGWYRNTRLMLEIQGPGEAVWNEYKALRQIVTNGYLRKEWVDAGLKNYFNNCKNYLYSRADALVPGMGSLHWKTTSANKVSLMERLRDCVQLGLLEVRSLDLLDEMRAIVREGDAIAAQGDDHDDLVLATALAIRCWEQAERPTLIAQNKTLEFEQQRTRMSMRDQYEMLTSHIMGDHFLRRQAERRQVQSLQRRMAWKERY